MAYGLMPSQTVSCKDAKQMYINGHFCYADKFAILTNGLSIVRHISFTDEDGFKSNHPDLTVEKKSDSPDEDKSVGDSAFDSANIYGSSFHDFHFSKALIPYNPRNESTLQKVGYNEYGYPTCPEDSSLSMKYHGVTKEKGRSERIKWGCPKMHCHHGWSCQCKTPCSTAVKGRTIVEQAINHFKINMCIAGRMTRNHTTTKSDVLLAGIASQLTVIVAAAMNYPQYIRSLKPLVS